MKYFVHSYIQFLKKMKIQNLWPTSLNQLAQDLDWKKLNRKKPATNGDTLNHMLHLRKREKKDKTLILQYLWMQFPTIKLTSITSWKIQQKMAERVVWHSRTTL